MKHTHDRKVTAVVPVHNSAAYIQETLHSLINQKQRFDEILVIDDGSTDETIDRAKQYPVRIVKVSRCGRSAARNIGWKEAKGDLIAFIESDAIYERNWLSEVMKAFENGHRAVIDRRSMYHPTTYYALLSNHRYDLRYADYVPFNAWVMEKALLEEVGGFDKDLSIAEDRELGDRIRAAGVTISLAEKAIHRHRGEASTFRAALKRSYQFGRGMFDYWWKDPEKRSLLRLARILALFWGIFCPPVFMYVFIKTYCKRFSWALQKGMKTKYILLDPTLYTVEQFALQAGATVTLARYLFIDKKLRLSGKKFISTTEGRCKN